MRVVVFALTLLAAFSIVASTATFSGVFTSSLTLDLAGSPDVGLLDFSMDLDVDYTFGGVTLGATAIIDRAEPEYVLFDAWGLLGALWFTSYLEFGGPASGLPMGFDLFAMIGGVTLGGVDFWGAWLIDSPHRRGYVLPAATGGVLGMRAVLGGAWVYATADLGASLYYPASPFGCIAADWPFAESYDMWVPPAGGDEECWVFDSAERFPFALRVCDDWYVGWPVDVYSAQSCSVSVTRLWVEAEVPMPCGDVDVQLEITDAGLAYCAIWLGDCSALDLPWLDLDYVGLMFEPDSARVFPGLRLVVADDVCFQPLFATHLGGFVIDSINLVALTCQMTSGGVTLRAGTNLDPLDYSLLFDRHGNVYPMYRFDPDVVCPPMFCYAMEGYDEYLGLVLDGEGCCGSQFWLSVFNWFDGGDDYPDGNAAGIFDWEETVLEARIGISSNATMTGGMTVENEGVDWIRLGVEVRF